MHLMWRGWRVVVVAVTKQYRMENQIFYDYGMNGKPLLKTMEC